MNRTLERLVGEREACNGTIDEILAAVEEAERDPSEAERELLSRHRARLEELEPQIGELLDIEERRESAREVRGGLVRSGAMTPVPASPEAPANAPVYRTFAQFARDEMIARFDVIATRAGVTPEAARERLTRAVTHTLTTDVPGLLPPQHLAQIIDVISAARPIVQSARQIALTNGKLTYPKITQRPTVSKQATEKTETPSQAMKVDMLDVLADTYLGAGNLSWQTIQWGVPDALNLWFQLAAEAYAKQTEEAAGATLVAAATTDSTPVGSDDFAGWYAAIVAAAGAVYERVNMPATTIWADVATAFKLGGMVSNLAPVFMGGGNISIASGAGSIAGLQLVPSYALSNPTVVVGVAPMLLCAETAGAPVELRAVEPSIGGMEVGVIGAFASEAMEPSAFQILTPPAGGAAAASAPRTTTGTAGK